MKRSGLPARTKPLRAHKRIKQRSARRVTEDETWRDVKMIVTARDVGYCQAERLLPHIACGGRNDPHHVWPTGTGGPRLDADNVVTVCRRHHDWVHAHPAIARSLGLLSSSSDGQAGYRNAAMRRRTVTPYPSPS